MSRVGPTAPASWRFLRTLRPSMKRALCRPAEGTARGSASIETGPGTRGSIRATSSNTALRTRCAPLHPRAAGRASLLHVLGCDRAPQASAVSRALSAVSRRFLSPLPAKGAGLLRHLRADVAPARGRRSRRRRLRRCGPATPARVMEGGSKRRARGSGLSPHPCAGNAGYARSMETRRWALRGGPARRAAAR